MMSLGCSTSADGIHWTRREKNSLYDEHSVEDMLVVRHEGTYYMFAKGKGDPAQLLTSAVGIKRQRVGPLDVPLKNGVPIQPVPYETPTAWAEAGTWYLFYECCHLGILLATSMDMKV